MIVADTNLLTYLLVEVPMLHLAEQVYRIDPQWIVPELAFSEFRNVLAGLMRNQRLDLAGTTAYWQAAEALLTLPEPAIDDAEICAGPSSACTAYDCDKSPWPGSLA